MLTAAKIMMTKKAVGGVWSPADDANRVYSILPGTVYSDLYQEYSGSSATTPATADTDPVGTIYSVDENRYIGDQTNGVGRPPLDITSGVTSIDFDGTNDGSGLR